MSHPDQPSLRQEIVFREVVWKEKKVRNKACEPILEINYKKPSCINFIGTFLSQDMSMCIRIPYGVPESTVPFLETLHNTPLWSELIVKT